MIPLDEGTYKGTYIGKEMCGFIKGHIYQLEISNNKRTYTVCAMQDYTDDKIVDLYMPYSNEKSIRRSWEIE